ncbi:hypothetical protein PsorP6_012730 [Peronosclerospora sorghi]|uniref:Uncharacterized protein n=1 Tax=Peronosclerospora sorghi TaxID=230839 RepID=A0ACC0WGX6_9STRA|nr:hypothetical protein PsorP6_012730 [Peronosclerospora sorghi]
MNGSGTRHWIPRTGYTTVMELCLKLATFHERQNIGERSEMYRVVVEQERRDHVPDARVSGSTAFDSTGSGLLYRPHTLTILRPVNVELQQHHPWMLTDDRDIIIHSDALLQRDPRTVASMSDCEREASADVPGSTVTFQGHPVLSWLVSLYSGEGRWRPGRKHYRRMKGEKGRDDALSRQAGSRSTVFDEMRQIKWTMTQRVPGLSPYAAHAVFPFKANKLDLWNHDISNLTCPHSSCSNVEHTNVKHVFWDCPVAVMAWVDFRARWQQLGEKVIDDAPRVGFSLEMPETPERAWNADRATLRDEEDDDPLRYELYPVASLL